MMDYWISFAVHLDPNDSYGTKREWIGGQNDVISLPLALQDLCGLDTLPTTRYIWSFR